MRPLLNAHAQSPDNADALGIIPHGIPLYWFGDSLAPVATVAINPGPAEFAQAADKRGYWGIRHDFGTHRKNYSVTELDAIERHCANYFSGLPQLDRFWNRLENLLRAGGASYVQPNVVRAFHVDLVPWATQPVWGKLQPWQQQALLAHADESRRRMFAELPARVLVCRGASATTGAGQTLGFFDAAPPWQRCSTNGDAVILRHPDGNRWLLGTRQWDFDGAVKEFVGDALKALLAGGVPASAGGTGNPPGPPNHNPAAPPAPAPAEALLALLHDVASEIAETEDTAVTLDVRETSTTYTVWMNGSRGKKVATIAKAGGKIEFPVSGGVVAAAAALVPELEFTLTWEQKQVCLKGITVANLPRVEAGLRSVIAAAIYDHPAF